MTNRMVNNRIQKLFDLESKKRELESMIESLKLELKGDLEEKGIDSLDTGKFIVRWTPVSSMKLDTARFKEDHSELFEKYSVESNYKRFSYSVH